ncbi:MAG: RNA-binding cell elongation regulator Jag/EloR [Clostridia bacterium]|nr:RNA-binding cell elongation regulator Jag/EloR [Clostridia bacterium]
MKFVEIKAKTVDEAVEKALAELNTTKENVDIEILEESKGLFGLLGSKEVKVRVTLLKEDDSAKAENFLKNITERLGMNTEFETVYNEEEKKMAIELKGDGLGLLIGRRGETLDALQYLTNIFVNKGSDDYIKVTLDAENYRERREDALVTLAKRTAAKATKYKKNMIIEPKNPYERRIIHEALQDYPEVTTYSIGEEPNRKVVVAYKGMAGTYRD